MLPVAILAGGLATRLHPITTTIPKALVDIAGEPFIAHQLRLLRRQGIVQVVVCLGYLGEQVEGYLGDGRQFDLQVAYSYDGPTLLGTAGALRQALAHLGSAFFVLYGDSYLPCDFRAVQHAFEASAKQGLMTVFRNEGRWDTSNVEFAAGTIVRYDKLARSPRMRHIDYGLGVFAAEAFAHVPADVPHDLARLYADLLARHELAAFEVSERFFEVGSPAGLAELRARLAAQRVGEVLRQESR